MLQLLAQQLNTLDKDALVIIAASLHEQLNAMSLQLDNVNRQLVDTSRQIELLTEQIHIMNQCQFDVNPKLHFPTWTDRFPSLIF